MSSVCCVSRKWGVEPGSGGGLGGEGGGHDCPWTGGIFIAVKYDVRFMEDGLL